MQMSSDTKLPYTYSEKSRSFRKQTCKSKNIRTVPAKDSFWDRFTSAVTSRWILRYIIIFTVLLSMSCIIMGVYYTSIVNHMSIIRPRLINLHRLTWSIYNPKLNISVNGHNISIDISDTKYSRHNQSLKYRFSTIIGVNNSRSRHTKTLYPLTLDEPYLLSNPNLCKSASNLSALVIVHTAPDHFERRDIMRKTWTNNSYFHHLGSVRILFLLGTVLDNTTHRKIEDEFKTYGDLVQGNFIDAYRNLTHKGVMGYKWISEYCMNAQMIVKVDDDVIMDTYKLLNEYIPKLSGRKRYILCNHIATGTMPIIRETKNKWFVSSDFFRGHKLYPQYCSGFSVIISKDIIPFLYRAAYLTPFFWVDDVYLYGMLPYKVKDIAYISLAGHFSLNFKTALECFENNTKLCPFLITGGGTPEEVVKLWNAMGKAYDRSSNINPKTSNISSENGDKRTDNGQSRKNSEKIQTPKQANVQTKEKGAKDSMNDSIKDGGKMTENQTEDSKAGANNTSTEKSVKVTDKSQGRKDSDKVLTPKQANVQMKEERTNDSIQDGGKIAANQTAKLKTRANNTSTEKGDKGTDNGQGRKDFQSNQIPKQASVQIKEKKANAAIEDGTQMTANKTEDAKTRANNTITV